MQGLQSELLQPLTETISSGYNGALLVCGASTETLRALTDPSIIRQVEPQTKLHLGLYHITRCFWFIHILTLLGLGDSVQLRSIASDSGVLRLRVISSSLSLC